MRLGKYDSYCKQILRIICMNFKLNVTYPKCVLHTQPLLPCFDCAPSLARPMLQQLCKYLNLLSCIIYYVSPLIYFSPSFPHSSRPYLYHFFLYSLLPIPPPIHTCLVLILSFSLSLFLSYSFSLSLYFSLFPSLFPYLSLSLSLILSPILLFVNSLPLCIVNVPAPFFEFSMSSKCLI